MRARCQAVNIARARAAADGASDAASARPPASDMGVVTLAVQGCPSSGAAPTAAAAPPLAVVVRRHAWALKAAARPGALFVRPRPGQGKAVFSLRVRGP